MNDRYPAEALDWLLPDNTPRVVELGAGTGRLTRRLRARGLDVVAVDPSAAMLTELRRGLPEVVTHVGGTEQIPLPDDERAAVLAQVRQLLATHPALLGRGSHALPYVTECLSATAPTRL